MSWSKPVLLPRLVCSVVSPKITIRARMTMFDLASLVRQVDSPKTSNHSAFKLRLLELVRDQYDGKYFHQLKAAVALGTNPTTVRSALQQLVREGRLIEVQPSKRG